jgi:hypothetical protein
MQPHRNPEPAAAGGSFALTWDQPRAVLAAVKAASRRLRRWPDGQP